VLFATGAPGLPFGHTLAIPVAKVKKT